MPTKDEITDLTKVVIKEIKLYCEHPEYEVEHGGTKVPVEPDNLASAVKAKLNHDYENLRYAYEVLYWARVKSLSDEDGHPLPTRVLTLDRLLNQIREKRPDLTVNYQRFNYMTDQELRQCIQDADNGNVSNLESAGVLY